MNDIIKRLLAVINNANDDAWDNGVTGSDGRDEGEQTAYRELDAIEKEIEHQRELRNKIAFAGYVIVGSSNRFETWYIYGRELSASRMWINDIHYHSTYDEAYAALVNVVENNIPVAWE